MRSGTEKNPNEKRHLVVSVEEVDTGAAVVCGKDSELDAVEALRARFINGHQTLNCLVDGRLTAISSRRCVVRLMPAIEISGLSPSRLLVQIGDLHPTKELT
jgi:hypothetical protein